MKSKDLRINSTIGWTDDGKNVSPVKVVGLGRDTITVEIGGIDYEHHENYQSHRAIKLNTDLITERGFRAHVDDAPEMPVEYRICWIKSEKPYFMFFERSNGNYFFNPTDTRIEFLHELENHYYDSNKEDLATNMERK